MNESNLFRKVVEMAWDTSTRRAGLLVPAFSLRHSTDFGIGDTTAVLDALEFCHQQGFRALQLLPINETGADHSPYNAISSVALEPALLSITPDTVPGLTDAILARLAEPELLNELRAGPVRYEEVKGLKAAILSEAFFRFEETELGTNSPLDWEFQAFTVTHSAWLGSYTLFRTLLNEYEGDALWPKWAPEHQTVTEAEAWFETTPNRGDLERYRIFYAWIQWVAFRQWGWVRQRADELKIELIGDIPFGVSRFGSDVWAERELFDLTWSGGAPPEEFFKEDPFTAQWGQNWGIPLYHWAAHQAEDYAWWKQRVARTCDIFHAFRIDHVLGFFRIFSFPWTPDYNWEFIGLTEEEAAEKTGGRLPQFLPRDDEPEELGLMNCQEGSALLRILHSAAPHSGILAEDLGMVSDYVRPALTELGIPGFTIPSWTRDEATKEWVKYDQLPALTIATYVTHDHVPLVTLYGEMVKAWTGPSGEEGWREMQRLMRFLGWEENSAPTTYTPELHLALLKRLLETPCFMAVFMITDLIGSSQRFNQPGTSVETNWSERLEVPLTAMESEPRYAEIFTRFRQFLLESGR